MIIPAMVALMALNQPIISVLFQRGAFDATAAVSTAQALFCYSLGLWAFSIIRVFTSAFYSLQDSKWPLKAALVSFGINIIASVILMYPLKHNGLALANSLAVMVNVLILSIALKNKIGKYLDQSFYTSLVKIILSSLVMLLMIMLVSHYHSWHITAGFKDKLTYLLATIAAGIITFFVSAYLLKSPEIHALVKIVRNRLGRSLN